MITKQQLKEIYPQVTSENIEKYFPFLYRYMEAFRINTPQRQAAFLAQIGHESAQLRYAEEIASGRAYEGRRDLGNILKGDGVRFKGRGLIQITGRSNYKQISEELNVDFVTNPELLSTPVFAVQSACWWWKNRDLNQLSDSNTEASFKRITRIINGGYNGLADRLQLWSRAKQVLGV